MDPVTDNNSCVICISTSTSSSDSLHPSTRLFPLSSQTLSFEITPPESLPRVNDHVSVPTKGLSLHLPRTVPHFSNQDGPAGLSTMSYSPLSLISSTPQDEYSLDHVPEYSFKDLFCQTIMNMEALLSKTSTEKEEEESGVPSSEHPRRIRCHKPVVPRLSVLSTISEEEIDETQRKEVLKRDISEPVLTEKQNVKESVSFPVRMPLFKRNTFPSPIVTYSSDVISDKPLRRASNIENQFVELLMKADSTPEEDTGVIVLRMDPPFQEVCSRTHPDVPNTFSPVHLNQFCHHHKDPHQLDFSKQPERIRIWTKDDAEPLF